MDAKSCVGRNGRRCGKILPVSLYLWIKGVWQAKARRPQVASASALGALGRAGGAIDVNQSCGYYVDTRVIELKGVWQAFSTAQKAERPASSAAKASAKEKLEMRSLQNKSSRIGTYEDHAAAPKHHESPSSINLSSALAPRRINSPFMPAFDVRCSLERSF